MDNLIEIGKVKPVHSKDVAFSRCGLGFEKLDRAVFEPEKAYDKVAELGVKWIRLQSGWQRTEKTKGTYDFQWLDDIVDNLISRGLVPWMCLLGNGLYDGTLRKVFGAVGRRQSRFEQIAAWDSMLALTKHFKGRIQWYEVWNEPDGTWCWKHGVNGASTATVTKPPLRKAGIPTQRSSSVPLPAPQVAH